MRNREFSKHQRARFYLILFLVFSFEQVTQTQALASSEMRPLGIAGWPTPPFNEKEPSPWLASDPVLGRLICPSLTRLNLLKKESEPFVLKSVHVERDAQKNTSWILGLRTGIFWWTGKELEAKDLALFLKSNLAKIIEDKGSGQWTLPEFKAVAERDAVRVTFSSEPEFGPYVLNGALLWRERKTDEAIKFECVGRFIPQKTGDDIVLAPNTRYQHEPQSYVFQSLENFRHKKAGGFEFAMAEDQPVAPSQRKVFEKVPCDCLVDLPMMSVVVWYENNPLLKDPAIRKRLSSLFPRDALLGIASGYWGSTPSGLIPKDHPGYRSDLSVSSFQLTRANERKPLFLSTMRGKVGLVEKVLIDNLLVGGFDVQFVKPEDKRVDGLVAGVFVPWPEMDFYDVFHSKGKDSLGRGKTSFPELDRDLDHYRRSLTQQIPDFGSLKNIHKHLHDLELISVLMQHQTCLEFRGITKKKQAIDVKDPDWFLSLLMMSGRVS